jgi:O-antigen/teichoic acid export membrane protein
MRKTFVSNLILLVGLNLLIKPFYILGIEAEIQNRVGADQFGSYFALINFSILLNIIPDMGITNWNTRRVAQEGVLNSKYLGSLLSLRLSLALVYALVCLFMGILIGYNAPQLMGLSLLVVNQIISSLILFFRSNLSGLHLFRHDSLLSILDKLLLVATLGYLLWFKSDFSFKIEYLIYAQTAALLVTLSLAVYWVSKHVQQWNWKMDKSLQKEILLGSLPFATLTLFAMIIYRADSVLLERIDGAQASGTYALGFRIFESYGMISYLFAGLLLPIFSRMLAAKDPIQHLVSLSSRILFSVTWTFCLLGFMLPEHLLLLIYDNPSGQAVDAFRWLMPGCFAFSMQYVYGSLLTADGKLKLLNGIMISMCIINLILNVIWIPFEGAVASAKVNAISHTIILLTEIVLVCRYYKISIAYLFKETALFVAFTLLLAVLFLTNYFSLTINDLPLAYRASLFIGLAVIAALITKMISYKALLQLLRSKE